MQRNWRIGGTRIKGQTGGSSCARARCIAHMNLGEPCCQQRLLILRLRPQVSHPHATQPQQQQHAAALCRSGKQPQFAFAARQLQHDAASHVTKLWRGSARL